MRSPKPNLRKMNRNTPVLLVLAGSFNPPHMAHLRMMELARETLRQDSWHVVGGIISPVHDDYKKQKKSLIEYNHRRAMVELAVQGTWIKCSHWEGNQATWSTTIQLLEALQEQGRLEHKEPNLVTKLVCGADLLDSFNIQGVWQSADIEKILSNHGLIVRRRPGSHPEEAIFNHGICYQYRDNIKLAYEPVVNDVSSTVLRKMVARNTSIRYLAPDPVCEYVRANRLYLANK